MICRGYLDIETTGLSSVFSELTVIGIGLEKGRNYEFTQLIGQSISLQKVMEDIKKVELLYTYNGSRFDLPFIRKKLGIDLRKCVRHIDLMYDCWRQNLYGGLKTVEKTLGISRQIEGIDGRMAVRLWYDYINNGNKTSLDMLMDYNKQDVLNLSILRRKLNVI